MNKKGSVIDVIIWMVIAFITLLFFAVWLYGHGILTDTLVGVEDNNPNINITAAARSTFLAADTGLQGLHLVAMAIIFGSAIAILVSNFLIKAHPVFFILYVIVIIIAVIFSVQISNTYETLLSNDTIGTELTGFKGSNFIMLNLPIWTTIIGFMGAIFLFAGIMVDQRAGGGIV